MSGSARPSHPKGHPGSSPRSHHAPARKISTGSADMLRAVVMAAKKNKAKEKEKGASRQDEDAVKEEEAMAWKLLSLTQINILLEQDIAGVQSIFQHYTLYEFLFYTPREEIVLGDENVVELVKPADSPFPAPLEEGLANNIYSKFIAQIPGEEDATKEMEGGVPLEEEAEAETIVDPLTGYTIEDVQMVLGQLTGEMLSGIQTEINERLQTQQEAYSARIDKLKKA
uniref:Ciliary associated calcium binding coiled-coil 1 n=1 Tax=Podarcis muralis TaxID=64176 RepID=A0A670IV05_PODMU